MQVMRLLPQNPIPETALKHPVKLLLVLTILVVAWSPVGADSGQDLAQATAAFEEAKAAVTYRVNTLPQAQRTAIWAEYYRALDYLEKMKIHHRMMEQHQADRSKQFNESRQQFDDAIKKLFELLPDTG